MTSKEVIIGEIVLCIVSFALGYAVAVWVGV